MKTSHCVIYLLRFRKRGSISAAFPGPVLFLPKKNLLGGVAGGRGGGEWGGLISREVAGNRAYPQIWQPTAQP